MIEQLGEDSQYNTTIDGQSYQVLERRYAIFPEHSGDLTIAPTGFSGRTVSATGRRSSFGRMDSLVEQMLSQSGFDDRLFGGLPFGDPGKRVRVGSNTLTLEIEPRPDGYSGDHWLPAQKLAIQDSWAESPPVIHAGEPVTRTLTLEAKGLEASQLPHLEMAGTDTLRIYPEQPELSNRTDGDWVFGRSEQRFTYVAVPAGQASSPGHPGHLVGQCQSQAGNYGAARLGSPGRTRQRHIHFAGACHRRANITSRRGCASGQRKDDRDSSTRLRSRQALRVATRRRTRCLGTADSGVPARPQEAETGTHQPSGHATQYHRYSAASAHARQ